MLLFYKKVQILIKNRKNFKSALEPLGSLLYCSNKQYTLDSYTVEPVETCRLQLLTWFMLIETGIATPRRGKHANKRPWNFSLWGEKSLYEWNHNRALQTKQSSS